MTKYFIVADVHGFYDELMDALNTAGFDCNNAEHIFVSLGDLLDRGGKPQQCLDFVNSLPADRKILVRGNHEDLMDKLIERKEALSHDYHNGTIQTLYDLNYDETKTINGIYKYSNSYKKYVECCVDYFDDGKNVFVHGWIPCYYNKLTDDFKSIDNWETGDWSNARWINGFAAWKAGVKLENKTIYCGHWHTSWAHHFIHKKGPEWDNKYSTNPDHRRADFSPFIDDGIVGLDACTAVSHKVNCYILEN